MLLTARDAVVEAWLKKVLPGLAAIAAVLVMTLPSFAQRGLLKGGLVMYRYKTDEQRGHTIGGGIWLRAPGTPYVVRNRRWQG
jgi:hypothetical protein